MKAVREGLPLAAAGLEPGDIVPDNVDLAAAESLNVRRGDEEVTLTLARAVPDSGGLRLRRTPRGAQVLGAPAPNEPAAKLGLREGDLVVRANGEDRPSAAALERLLTDPQNARLIVMRGDEKLLLEMPR